MLETLSELPVHVRPVFVKSGDYVIAYLDFNSYAHSVVRLLDSAKHSLQVSMFAINARVGKASKGKVSVFESLIAASDRGVSCCAVLASVNPFAFTRKFNEHATFQMKEAGWSVRWASRSGLLHQKQIIIDGRILLVGSHNISVASQCSNLDVTVAIESSELSLHASNEFQKIFYKSSVVKFR